MGWWRIEPETGMPLKDGHSKLSRPGEFILLNAVPGVDDEDSACYMGDCPWDMVGDVNDFIEQALGQKLEISVELLKSLLADGVLPQDLAAVDQETQSKLKSRIEEMWRDVDWCYSEDWQRSANPVEKHWIVEHLCVELTNKKSAENKA